MFPVVYGVYHDDGKMKSYILTPEDTPSGQPLPQGTIVFFSHDGVMEWCILKKDTEIQGYLSRGKADNWQTTFYPDGKLRAA